MKTIKFFSILMAVAIIFNSCSKGDTGATGPQGPSGTNGTNGTNGVANISSTTLTLTPSQWSGSSNYYYYVYGMSSISSIPGCAVMVYAYDGTVAYEALPLSSYWVVNDNLDFSVFAGGINFIYLNGGAPAQNITFDITVIPPAAIVNHPNTNWNNYSEVKAIIDAQKVQTN